MAEADPFPINDTPDGGTASPAATPGGPGAAVAQVRKRRTRSVLMALGLILAVVAGLWYWFGQPGVVETDNAYVKQDIIAVAGEVTGLVTSVKVRENQHVKAGDHIEIERRGTRAGHQYHLLGHIGSNDSGVVVEPYLITLTTESDVFPAFQHDGLELLFMLEGEVKYRHGDQLFHLEPGDSLFFDADAQHGPEVLVKLPARYLSVISYPQA